jgi:cation diffusion facilitator CzcD-associated flavoprotein CzcO
MTVPVAIIGAGPYGLSLAAHLAARGIEHRIFGQTMRTWDRHMPSGMFLKSEGFASNIHDPEGRATLRSFCQGAGHPYADAGRPVPIETFRAYGRWFQRRLVPHVEEDEVTTLSGNDEGFSLELGSGARATARRVVVASGITDFAYIPPELQSLRVGRVSHTSNHVDFDDFRGFHVAVIGAGQSALETAALIREAGGHPELIVRSAALNWNPDPDIAGYDAMRRRRLQPRPTPLGGGWELWRYWNLMPAFSHLPEHLRVRFVQRVLGPAGAWWLRSRVAETIPVRLGQKLVGAHGADGGLVIDLLDASERRQFRVDHVIAGTGYRIDVDRLTFLAPELRSRISRIRSAAGAPLLSGRFESSVPGLYFVGLAAANTYGPAMRFVCGTSFVAPRLARELAAAPIQKLLRLSGGGRLRAT